jgi:hypothetical protein
MHPSTAQTATGLVSSGARGVSGLPGSRRRAHPPDVSHLQRDGLRVAAQRPLHMPQWACDRRLPDPAYLPGLGTVSRVLRPGTSGRVGCAQRADCTGETSC